MTPRTPSEEAIWNAVCAAEFVRLLAAYHARHVAWPEEDLRAAKMRDARIAADWAVQASRNCDASDRLKAKARHGF